MEIKISCWENSILAIPPLMRFAVVTVISLTLCSCMSPERKFVSQRYGLSADNLPLVEGRWRNASKNTCAPTLWESLTSDYRRTSKKTSPYDSVIKLEILDERTLNATLLKDGVKTDSRTFGIKQRESWFELPTHHIAHPLVWYVVWGWETREIALGIDGNGDLWVNTIGNGIIVILIMPTPVGGGGGPGMVSLYERTD